MYELKSQYFTGIEAIDEQHSRIFKLADDAYKLLKDENKLFKDDDLAKIISGLQDYAKYHFSEEEAYMEKMGFKEISFIRESIASSIMMRFSFSAIRPIIFLVSASFATNTEPEELSRAKSKIKPICLMKFNITDDLISK